MDLSADVVDRPEVDIGVLLVDLGVLGLVTCLGRDGDLTGWLGLAG